jgi:hypothetical protein
MGRRRGRRRSRRRSILSSCCYCTSTVRSIQRRRPLHTSLPSSRPRRAHACQQRSRQIRIRILVDPRISRRGVIVSLCSFSIPSPSRGSWFSHYGRSRRRGDSRGGDTSGSGRIGRTGRAPGVLGEVRSMTGESAWRGGRLGRRVEAVITRGSELELATDGDDLGAVVWVATRC